MFVKHVTKPELMLCPVCNSKLTSRVYNPMAEYNHIQNIDINQKGENAWGEPAEVLVISMRCEERHEWELCITEREGNVFVFTRAVRRLGSGPKEGQS